MGYELKIVMGGIFENSGHETMCDFAELSKIAVFLLPLNTSVV